jgi:hypothetical protein
MILQKSNGLKSIIIDDHTSPTPKPARHSFILFWVKSSPRLYAIFSGTVTLDEFPKFSTIFEMAFCLLES